MAQQAAELEDTDIPPPPAMVPSPLLPAQQVAPVPSALERQLSPDAPAAVATAALQTSASMPAARTASISAAASLPAVETASMPAAAQCQAADSDTSPAPVHRPSQELQTAVTASAAAGAPVSADAVDGIDSAAGAATGGGDGGGGDDAGDGGAMSGGQSERSGGKVWLPPAALASPQRSSGRTTATCGL